MIKATATSENGEKLVLIGLSDTNLEKLKEGSPILVEMWELGFTGKLVIMGGGTEDELAKMFRQNMSIENEVDERKPQEGN